MKQESEGRKSKNELIEQYLAKHYDFRFNVIKSKPEFCKKASNNFQSVSKYTLNSFKRELDTQIGVITSAENIRAILESDFSKKVHPVKAYFENLPRLDPDINNYIGQLSQTVKVTNDEKWLEYLRKWLTGVVANALNDYECKNHVCLVLTGAQGKFKTTWLDHLCPSTLQSYSFTGKLDTRNKDVQTLIAEYLFINIDDQLKSLNKRDEHDLKNLITTPFVKYRRPYDTHIEEYPHLASFMASVNGNDFLTDATGTRRFLPFEALEIDIEATKKINMDNVFSEALWLYEKKYRYWFNDPEIEILYSLSQQFHVQSTEYETLVQYFQKPENSDVAEFMTTSQILAYLKNLCSLQLTDKRMGEALRKAGFERVSKRVNSFSNPVYGFNVKKTDNVSFS